MCLYIASLNSGSNGNCYYIGNENEAVFIDAGISCRETEKRISRLGLAMKQVKAIVVSHEHSDHIAGVEALSKKYHLPVYITDRTLEKSGLSLDMNLVASFRAEENICIGKLSVIPFIKHHDAHDPHSFIVCSGGICVGVFTDIGIVCDNVLRYFKQCHAAFLESNYDEEMLLSGKYPFYLKQRIRGGKGHLSNHSALQLFKDHRSSYISHLILSHLSKNNNRPELVQQLFAAQAGSTEIIIAPRYGETKLIKIESSTSAIIPPPLATADKRTAESTPRNKRPVQLSIFSDF